MHRRHSRRTAPVSLVSFAEGQFLSGTIAGMDLANVAALQSAWARNDGTQGMQSSKDPLDAEVLQTINVQSPNGVQLDLAREGYRRNHTKSLTSD